MTLVAFRHRPGTGAAPKAVLLAGETSDFRNARALRREADGSFALELELPVGVYAYKLIVDGAWTLDAENPRTRSSGGARNNVVVVGGADEPLLFAPATPFVAEHERGGMRVLVGLRHGAPGPLSVSWSERPGELDRRSPLAHAFDEDEHAFFEARLPASARRIELAILRGEERLTPTFVHERAPGADKPPAWWASAVLYAIYVDRFRPSADRTNWREDPGKNVSAGGDLEGVRRSLDEIAALGATALYLTPLHVAQSSHRYDFVDPLRVDPALGGEEALRALVSDCHARGLRVLLDFSLAHAGSSFPPAADVLARGRASEYASWFQWDEGADRPRMYGARTDAPLLDLDCPAVRDLALRVVDFWAGFDIDGLRIDMAAEVPLDLARAVRRRFLDKRPDGIVFGELVPAHAWRWCASGALDAATDFAFHGMLVDLVGGKLDGASFAARLRSSELTRGGTASTFVRFACTHDHPRLATLASFRAGGDARLGPAYVLFLTMPGIPALLYGEELGLRARDLVEEPEGAWPDRMPMPWDAASRATPLGRSVRELLATRRASSALTRGELEVLHAERDVLVFRRRAEGDVVDVAVNFGATVLGVSVADDDWPRATVACAVGDASLEADGVARLGPNAALVLRRERSQDRERVSDLAHARNLGLRALDFVGARRDPGSRPTRIDFAVTETCNLRCAHCITFAPDRTRSGTARTFSPWLLDRIRDDLGYATYFGFVHGGESLAAPIFFDVLDAIRRAHGQRPYVAHLLTNGLLLTRATTDRLIDAGVRSISVSLDGASAATNDAVRLGGRFDRVVEHVRAARQARDDRGADLRLGISSVLTNANLREAPRLVDLAADLGADWIKLEELVPVSAQARSLLYDGAAMRAATEAARARAQERGIRFVDHTRERTIWRCRLGGDAEFLEADEYANRSEIHPCRAPWEIACVEPNGDVRIVDFFGPVIGNISEAPLDEIWNAPEARAERARSQHARVCGLTGPVVCEPEAQRPR